MILMLINHQKVRKGDMTQAVMVRQIEGRTGEEDMIQTVPQIKGQAGKEDMT